MRDLMKARRSAGAAARPEPVYRLARAILIPWLRHWFRWHIEGLEHLPRRGPALLAFNHIAYLDPLAIAVVVDRAGRRPRFLTKSELFRDRRIAWALRGTGQIEVKRGTSDATKALEDALQALERGEIVVIFPEGTVTTKEDLSPLPAKSGVARLSLASGVPVTPCGIWGTANIWPKGQRNRWTPRQLIAVQVGSPLRLDADPEEPATMPKAAGAIQREIARLVDGLKPLVADRRRPRPGD
jgi:1-acyl-sn-glycerol-3-phosphate acyltransferase